MDELISRQAAINKLERAKVRVSQAIVGQPSHSFKRAIGRGTIGILDDVEKDIRGLPPSIQPDKDKVSDLLYCIYSIQSPHLDMCGVIAKKYYCEELWKELFGKESELPGWMN